MSHPRTSIQVTDLPGDCDSCQHCEKCDPKPEYASNKLRFCGHGFGSKFIEQSNITASGHRCPPKASSASSPNTKQKSSFPRSSQRGPSPLNRSQQHDKYQSAEQRSSVPQSAQPGQAPSISSQQYSSLQSARDEVLFEDITSKGKTKGQYGDNYKTVPAVEGKRVYRKITSEGDSRVHYGNNYGRAVSPATGQPEIAPHLG
jgi:hypothetical protein